MQMRSSRTASFLVGFAILVAVATVHAGVGGFGNRGSVGGVMIDGNGVVRAATVAEQRELKNLLRTAVKAPQGEMADVTDMRMVSLKGLQQAVRDNRKEGRPINSDIEYLAGLQRVEYVFVDKDNHDIILAGPAEPWKLSDDGNVVGTKTGGATLRLADLMVALQSVEQARAGGISCSIEPTAEGRQRLRKVLSNVKLRPGQSPAILEATMKEAFGPQMIHLTGVPADSRYARTIVAADFEMKRVAMGLTDSPVAGLPSYLQMAKNGRHGAGQNPRWWMACNYDSLSRTEDGLAWKLAGQGVKTMTEQDIVARDGSVTEAGRTDKTAQAWADKMTEKFSELARERTVFGDLQNVMDLTIVATLIVQERLADQAGLDLTLLSTQNDTIELDHYAVPKSVDPQCSFIKGNKGWVVTASGGVDINGFEVVQNQVKDDSIASARTEALAASREAWWWNK